jgi:hypothetical protein
MTNKISKGFVSIVSLFIITVATSLSVPAQARMPIPRPTAAGGPLQELTGLVRIPKDFGIVPAGPGLTNQAAALPCFPFYVAVLDPDNNNKVIATTEGLLEPGRDVDNFYTCRYSLKAPRDKRLYAIAGMGGPKQTRWSYYITDAWVGGTNNKPRRGWERGFAGKFVTLGTKGMYLRFDLHYAQVDPN